MPRQPTTVAQYLAALPPDRRSALQAVREVILANLDDGYEEGIQYGAIGYFVPHRVFPAGYHCDAKQPLPFGAIAWRKGYMAIGFMPVYGDPEEERWLRKRFAAAGKKLDMGKVCMRFKKLEDLPLDVIGELVRRTPSARYVADYERALAERSARSSAKARRKAKPKTRAGARPARTGSRAKRAAPER